MNFYSCAIAAHKSMSVQFVPKKKKIQNVYTSLCNAKINFGKLKQKKIYERREQTWKRELLTCRTHHEQHHVLYTLHYIMYAHIYIGICFCFTGSWININDRCMQTLISEESRKINSQEITHWTAHKNERRTVEKNQ